MDWNVTSRRFCCLREARDYSVLTSAAIKTSLADSTVLLPGLAAEAETADAGICEVDSPIEEVQFNTYFALIVNLNVLPRPSCD